MHDEKCDNRETGEEVKGQKRARGFFARIRAVACQPGEEWAGRLEPKNEFAIDADSVTRPVARFLLRVIGNHVNLQ